MDEVTEETSDMKLPKTVRALTTILPLVVAMLATHPKTFCLAEPPRQSAWDDVLSLYRELGLPVPPKHAKLVRFPSPDGIVIDKASASKKFVFAFKYAFEDKNEGTRLLIGLNNWDCSSSGFNPVTVEILPKPAANLGGIYLSADELLIFAIQCHALGWSELADHIYGPVVQNDDWKQD